MGGTWDATNVADAHGRGGHPDRGRPRAVPRRHAGRRSPWRRPGSSSPARPPSLAEQTPEVGRGAARARCAEVGATAGPRGPGVRRRHAGAGRRRPDARRCRGCAARYDEVFLPLYGAHQAQNAAARAGRGRGVPGGDDAARRRASCARRSREVTSPGRLEIIRRSPTIVLDAAHNPHGAAARGRGARGLVHVLAR